MNNIVNSRKKNKDLSNSGQKKPFLSIDSEFNIQELHKILLKNPYLVNTEDEKNETFLSYAIKRNNNSIINLILTSPLLNLTYQNENGNSYLHLAVIQQNLKLVEKLLDKDIFIDIQNNDGNTALHLAYYVNNLKIIKLLIYNNIDFGIKNKLGLTAEEIDPTDDINKIAGYEVNYEFDGDENEELNNLCLDLPEEFNLKKQNIDSSNSRETKYKSQFSKEKKNSSNKNTENGNSPSNDNKDKNDGNSLKIEDNNLLLFDLNKNNDNIDNDKQSKRKIFDNKISSNFINHYKSINKDNNKSKNNKNKDQLYEEPIEDSQDIIFSNLNSSKKNNFSNFLENNEFNNSNNSDNNSIHFNHFFLNDKGENQSLLSNIPIKNDENLIHDFNKNNNCNKVEIKKEKIIDCKNKPLYDFLMQINMQKYYDNLNNNGFEYIDMIIDDEKLGNYLKDKQLKMIGINIPGDRAKILIRFEEKANLFEFNIPKRVYYIINNMEEIEDDINITKLNGWLQNIKLEQYLNNFIKNGYFSLDLLLFQSLSKNPLTDEILKDEIGIEKIGHRARILNKLKEESNKFANRLRDSVVTFHTTENSKICNECIIS